MNTKHTPGKRICPHCGGSLERYEDPKAVEIISDLESKLKKALKACEAFMVEWNQTLRDDYKDSPLAPVARKAREALKTKS